MNRAELVQKMNQVSGELLREKGFISFVDVLMRMGKLSAQDQRAWRMGQVPFLERVIKLNLSQISFLHQTLRQNARNGKLKPSWTAYMSWGKGPRRRLRFSKSGNPSIEKR